MPAPWGHGCSPEPVLVAELKDWAFHQEDMSRLSKGSARAQLTHQEFLWYCTKFRTSVYTQPWRVFIVRWLWAHNTKYNSNSMLTGPQARHSMPSRRAEDEFLRCLWFENLYTLFSLPLIHRSYSPHSVSSWPTGGELTLVAAQPWWLGASRCICGPGWAPAAAGTYLVRDTCWVPH